MCVSDNSQENKCVLSGLPIKHQYQTGMYCDNKCTLVEDLLRAKLLLSQKNLNLNSNKQSKTLTNKSKTSSSQKYIEKIHRWIEVYVNTNKTE